MRGAIGINTAILLGGSSARDSRAYWVSLQLSP
jgi:hypothetical protein